MPLSEAPQMLIDVKKATSVGDIKKLIKELHSNLPQPYANEINNVLATRIIMATGAIANIPNISYIMASGLNNSWSGNILMNPAKPLETQELTDEEEFMMLSADVISDLIDEEPEIHAPSRVRVRFR